MPLTTNQPIGFIPTQNPETARAFYEHTLGLYFEADDGFALVFRLGSARRTMLRDVRVGAFTPAPFTIFGWEVDPLDPCVTDLVKRGVEFLRFPHFEQDTHRIWSAPGGTRVAWFKDPDGNTLSLSQHTT